MNKQSIRISAAVLDTTHLTMYKEDGSTVVLEQGDPRIRRILDVAVPQLSLQNYADVDIGVVEENQYAKFEEQSSGVVRFFKIAKDKLKGLFGLKPEEPDAPLPPQVIGCIPGPTTVHSGGALHNSQAESLAYAEAMVAAGPKNSPETKDVMSIVEEIMQHAIPASAPEFHERSVHKQGDIVEEGSNLTNRVPTESLAPDTIIAVVDGQIIPGMEMIKSQFTRAAKLGSTIGVENFLRRVGAVIDKRQHSIDDLLKFMERGDLPLADDGSILIYKVLKRKGSNTSGKYVDCHTGKVEQWPGAYVCMAPSLVDTNRRNECSNGLHVARRGYINGFSGNVCVLAKLAPEDVIAVPSYDANKMRVCGYHILMELSDAQYSLVKQNRPMSEDVEGKQLLANALAGRHDRITHEVRITEANGGGVKVTAIEKDKAVSLASGIIAPLNLGATVPTPSVFSEAKQPAAKPAPVEALSNSNEEEKDAPVEPKAVMKEVEAQVERVQTSRKEQAGIMYNAWYTAPAVDKDDRLAALRAFKKTAKVGWDKLGISNPEVTGMVQLTPVPKTKKPKAGNKGKVVKAAKKPAKTPQVAQVILEGEQDRSGLALNDDGSDAKVSASRVVNGVELGLGSPRERIQKLLAIGLTSVGTAQAILSLKKQSRKSWFYLGVDKDQVVQIEKLAKS